MPFHAGAGKTDLNIRIEMWLIQRSPENLLSSCGHMNVNVVTAGGFGDSDNTEAGGWND